MQICSTKINETEIACEFYFSMRNPSIALFLDVLRSTGAAIFRRRKKMNLEKMKKITSSQRARFCVFVDCRGYQIVFSFFFSSNFQIWNFSIRYVQQQTVVHTTHIRSIVVVLQFKAIWFWLWIRFFHFHFHSLSLSLVNSRRRRLCRMLCLCVRVRFDRARWSARTTYKYIRQYDAWYTLLTHTYERDAAAK